MTSHRNTFPQVGASLTGTPVDVETQGEPGAVSGISTGELGTTPGGGTDTDEGGGAGAIVAVAAVAALAYFLYK